MTSRPRLAVTMGDPAGIGPEVLLRAAPRVQDEADLLAVGDVGVLRSAAARFDIPIDIHAIDSLADATSDDVTLPVLPVTDLGSVEYGVIDAEYGRASLAYIERAVDLAIDATVDGMVTGPINKAATRRAGSEYTGHTDLLAARTDTQQYAMMLLEDDLRVTHVSTHVPLTEAIERVTTERILKTIEVTVSGLLELGVADPRIAVAGLNPHAGDGGVIGHEDRDRIAPAVEAAREQGVDVVGPVSPDSVFSAAVSGAYDCVVAMYHDQGHIPVKMVGAGRGDPVGGVNVTVGLPIVRTSVDHGTAFDIAGDGVASERSMVEAIETAVRIVMHRRPDRVGH